jgi:GLPGLI family protein
MNKNNWCSLLIVVFTTTSIISQNIGGEVLYKLRLTKNMVSNKTISKKDNETGKMLNFMNQSLNRNVEDFQFLLKFNSIESIFKMVDALEDESNKSYKIAVILSEAGNVYYLNKKMKKRIVSKMAYGEKVKVKTDIDIYKWVLHNNYKKIGKYQCYKATTFKTVKNNKGVFKKEIVAWYTPQIPYSFGPKGYGGLPGLILELKEGNLTYYSTKIRLNIKVKINKLSEKGLVKQQELDSIGRSLIKKRSF